MRATILFFEGQEPLFQGIEPALDKKNHTLVFAQPRYLRALEELKALGWKVIILQSLSLEAMALRLKNRRLIIPFPDKRFQKNIAFLKKNLARRVLIGFENLVKGHHERFQKDLQKRSKLTLETSVEALRSDCKVLIDEDAYEDEELLMGGLCTAKPKSIYFPKAKPTTKRSKHLLFPYAQKVANKGSLQAQGRFNFDAQETQIEVSLPESVGRKAPISIKTHVKKPIVSFRSFEEESKGKD